MRKVYELFLLPDAAGIRIAVSSEIQSLLAQYYNTSTRYPEMFGKKDEFVPFTPYGRFGYYGMLEEEGGSILAPFTQKESPYYLSASLFILFRCTLMIDRDPTDRIEPMEISLELTPGNGGSALYAECSGDFHAWLDEVYGYGTETSIPIAKEAMLAAGDILRRGRSTGWHSHVRSEMLKVGGFNLHCDSNCCCMGGKGERGKSFSMSTHNSDTPHTQLTFLAGLAALSGAYLNERG